HRMFSRIRTRRAGGTAGRGSTRGIQRSERGGGVVVSCQRDSLSRHRRGDCRGSRCVRCDARRQPRGARGCRRGGASLRQGSIRMLAILAPILVFGLVIFVHELGHFLAAKAMGVYAPRFSIGFGPSLFRKRWGETEYILALLPLGGYVRMASRLDDDAALLEGGTETAPRADSADYDPNAMIPFGPLPIPERRLFESKPLPARLLILIAGVS